MDKWRKSSYSTGNGGSCVELADNGLGTVIRVRDTKEAHLGDARTVLAFTPGAWSGFMSGIKAISEGPRL